MTELRKDGSDPDRTVGQVGGFSQHRQKLSRSVFSGPAAALLRERIISGALPPGTKLAETKLAEEFAVSRGPIRNALQALESEGLVRTLPNGRVVVVGFTQDDVEDLIHTRLVLESAAAELAINRKANLSPLVDALAALEAEETYSDRMVDLDIAFHVAILNVSGSRFLTHAWQASASVIHAGVTSTNQKLVQAGTDAAYKTIIDLHRAILDGMLARDVDQVLKALQAHFGFSESVFTRLQPKSERTRRTRR